MATKKCQKDICHFNRVILQKLGKNPGKQVAEFLYFFANIKLSLQFVADVAKRIFIQVSLCWLVTQLNVTKN